MSDTNELQGALPDALIGMDLLNPNVNVPKLLELFGAGAAAYDAYLKQGKWEDFVVFLDNIPGFPKERIPRQKNIAIRMLKQLEVRFAPKAQTKEFAAIANSVDEILRLDAGPQGALLQNLVKACLQRIMDLESASSTLSPDKRTEDSIVKYVAEIRNLMESISTYHKTIAETRAEVAKQVKEEVTVVMNAVKESAMALFPDKIEDFQRVLISKLTQYKKP